MRPNRPPSNLVSISAWKRKLRLFPRVPVSDYPRLTRFYGLTPQQLAATPQNILGIYADALEKLEAEEQLRAMTASLYPHMTEESASRTRSRLLVQAGIHTEADEPIKIDLTSDEGKEVLAGLGIGVAS